MTDDAANSKLPMASGAIQRVVQAEALPILSVPGPHAFAESHKPHLLHVLWRRKWIVVATLVLCLGAGIGYALWYATPIYVAASRIYVQQTGPKIMATDSPDARPSSNYLNTECMVIQSAKVLGPALALVKDIRTFAGDPSPYGALALNLKAATGKNDDLITVSFESPYREDAIAVVRAVVNAYTDNQVASKRDSAEAVLNILEPEKTRYADQLKIAKDKQVTFRKDHPELGFHVDKGNIIVQKLDRLSSALTECELAIVEARSSCEAVRAVIGLYQKPDPAPAPRGASSASETHGAAPRAPGAAPRTAATAPHDSQAASGPAEGGSDASIALEDPNAALMRHYAALNELIGAIRDPNDWQKINRFLDAKRGAGVYVTTQDEETTLRTELNALLVQLQTLRLSFAPGHPNIARVERQVEEVKRRILERQETLARSQLTAVWEVYRAAFKKRESLQAAYNKQMNEALLLNKSLADYAGLQNDIDQLTKVLEALDERIKELKRSQSAGALNISVLEPASASTKPTKPDKPRIIGIAGAIGLLLGVGLAMLRSWMDPRLTSTEEVAGLLGVPVVGVLPRIKGRPGLAHLGRNVLDAPMSPIAEAYRGIRTALHFGLQGAHAKTVLITSPAPGDGKSSLISNLAITMAQAGQRTLVIDADLLSPRQHEIFGLSNAVGLAAVLSGEATLEQAIHVDGDHGPDILPSGRVRSHTSELLNSRAFVDMIRDLSETYDQILIDSPPLLSVTDPLVLAAISDVTVLVLRAERSHRKMAEQAREGLTSVGARVFGAVVNDVKGRGARYGGYYRYYAGRQEYAEVAPQEGSPAPRKT